MAAPRSSVKNSPIVYDTCRDSAVLAFLQERKHEAGIRGTPIDLVTPVNNQRYCHMGWCYQESERQYIIGLCAGPQRLIDDEDCKESLDYVLAKIAIDVRRRWVN